MLKIMSTLYKNRFIYKFHVGLYVSMILFILTCLGIKL